MKPLLTHSADFKTGFKLLCQSKLA